MQQKARIIAIPTTTPTMAEVDIFVVSIKALLFKLADSKDKHLTTAIINNSSNIIFSTIEKN